MQQRSDDFGSAISRRQVTILGAIIALLVGSLAILFAFLKANYAVLEKGQILPYTEGNIYKVRLFDSFDVYLEPERHLNSDLITGSALTYISAMSLVFLVIIARAGGSRHRGAFWMFMLMATGAGYLAADETLGIHESIGHNLQFLRQLPLVDKPDDVIMLSYAVPMLLFLYVFRREILPSRAAIVAMLLVVVFYMLAAISDLASGPFEEMLEVASVIGLFAAVLLLGLHHIADLLVPRAGPCGADNRHSDGMA